MSSSYDTPGWRLRSALVTYNAKCRYCGSRHNLVAHHRIPRAYGGSDALDNVEPVCRRCHPWAESMSRARVMYRAKVGILSSAPLPGRRRVRRVRRITPGTR